MREVPSSYQDLRSLALNATAESLGFPALTATAAYGVVMDMAMDRGIATLVSFLNGDASIYLSTGGGMIGGGAHSNVNQAAKDFVAAASLAIGKMRKSSDFPPLGADQVAFYVLTPSGMFSAGALAHDLQNGYSVLSSLYAAGQKVVTAYRHLDGK